MVPRHRAVLVGLWVTAGLLPVVALLTRRARRPVAAAAMLGAWAASAVQFHVLARRIGRFRWWTAPAHPGLLVAFTGLVVRSEVARRRGVVRWKGRQVAVGRGVGSGPGEGRGDASGSSPRRARIRAGMRSMRPRL